MRRFFCLAIVCISLYACNDVIRTNTPVIQGSVNKDFFRAADATAVINDDGSVKLTGVKNDRTITLQTASPEVGQYTLGNNPLNLASFLAHDQVVYLAGYGSGDGLIEITEVSGGTLSGIFYFNAFSPAGKPLNFQKGVFFEVPITNATPEEDTTNLNVLTAEIDGEPFDAEVVSVQNSLGVLLISGVKQTATISLKFATDIAVGDYDLIAMGIPTGSYTVNSTSESSATGTLTILSNDLTAQTLEGSFEFTTDVSGTVISSGSFTVSY